MKKLSLFILLSLLLTGCKKDEPANQDDFYMPDVNFPFLPGNSNNFLDNSNSIGWVEVEGRNKLGVIFTLAYFSEGYIYENAGSCLILNYEYNKEKGEWQRAAGYAANPDASLTNFIFNSSQIKFNKDFVVSHPYFGGIADYEFITENDTEYLILGKYKFRRKYKDDPESLY